MKKKTILTGAIWSVAALLNLVLTLILVQYHGILGAAMASLLSFSFAFFSTLYYAKKYISLAINYKFILNSITASIAMSILLIVIKPEASMSLIIVILSAALVYFVILIALKGFSKQEVNFFKNLLKH